MPYQRLRPRSNDDAHRDRNRDGRDSAYDAYRHDTRDSPIRGQSGAGAAPAAVAGSQPAPAPAQRTEVLQFAVGGGAATAAGGYLFSILSAYDDGSVERTLGPITLEQGGATSAVSVGGMAYGLGADPGGRRTRPAYLYMLDTNNLRIIPYNLATGQFEHGLTNIPAYTQGIAVGDPFTEEAQTIYMASRHTDAQGLRTGRMWSSSSLRGAAFPSTARHARLNASNSMPTGLAYERGPQEATSYFYVADANGHVYVYTEIAINAAIRSGLNTAVAAVELDLAAAEGSIPANSSPSAVAYGLRLAGATETVPRLYVADNTARRVFAYEPMGHSALERKAEEDLPYGEGGIGVGAGALYGLASFPTDVEAAAHANLAIPHGPPPVPSGTRRLVILMPESRAALVAVTDPPRLMSIASAAGAMYTQRSGSRSNIRSSRVMMGNLATHLDSGVIRAGTTYGIGWPVGSNPTSVTPLHAGRGIPLSQYWTVDGLTGATARLKRWPAGRYVYMSNRWQWVTGDPTTDVPLAPRRAGARQSAIPLPTSVICGTWHQGLNKFLLCGLGPNFAYHVYRVPVPASSATGAEIEDRWPLDGVTPLDIADVQLAQGTRVAVLSAARTVEMFTNEGTRMRSESVSLRDLTAEDGTGQLTGSSLFRGLAQASSVS